MRTLFPIGVAVLAGSLLAVALPAPARAQDPASDPTASPADQADQAALTPSPKLAETIQVTATRTPEDVEPVPAIVTVIPGDEIAARGATDLASALALAGGVVIAPGGDSGPASSVPELWGLREFDAFLLVVDGVPWGGAFNPDIPTLDLHDVDRIEVQRGAAPVLYGATSFVGVIHVIHRAAGSPGRRASVFAGSYGSAGAAASTPLPALGSWVQSIAADAEQRGFKDDRTGFDRGHVLYRGAKQGAGGSFRLDLDGTFVRQDPASPHPRQGRVLSSLVPLDANHNPRDARLDQDRWHLVGGYDRSLGAADWSTTLALTHSTRDTLRGFLNQVADAEDNATGFRQDLEQDDLYFDSHLVWKPSAAVQVVAGVDHLYGKAKAESEDFDYTVGLDGSGAPRLASLPGDEGFDLEDERNFSGLYGQVEWNPLPRWRVQAGVRLNRTTEDREAGERDLRGGGEEEEEEGKVSDTTTRGSGSLGVSWLAWQADGAALWLFADYRDTYKPAAIDFGPEAEAELLEPETAKSWEVGAKGRGWNDRLSWEVSAFQMDFKNLVVAQTINGLPALINAGAERFRGGELEARLKLTADLSWQVAFANHDARFGDFVRDFDGVETQLRGNRLELSARTLAATGLTWAPPIGSTGWSGWVLADYVGERFLNQRNTALAPDYTLWSAGVGYRFPSWELRLDGENLGDERPPVAESELGDAQYYRQPARSFRLSLRTGF